jgi:CheY-like chemotaxis protein/HPt (histidine-containing phosphotransfer) domain-containing protein
MDAIQLLESAPAEALHAPDSASEAAPRLDGMEVLVVDDGETNRQLLRILLTRAGAAVFMAEHGLAAVEQASQRRFDAILMDMQMPVMDGYTATQELRARNNTTPVIALTANAMTGEEENSLAAGCDGYLTKPVNQKELVRLLARILPAAVRPASPTVEVVSNLDLEDPELREIVLQFVADLSNRCGELRLAAEATDWHRLAVRAHSLKGTAAMTGFLQLSEAAGRLEQQAIAKDGASLWELISRVESFCDAIRSAYPETSLIPA